MTIEEKAKSFIGNYKGYTELINRLEDVKNAIKKQNYGIAMDILCKPYPEFQITTSTELAESEDERIRKALIDGFKGYDDGSLFNGCLVRDIVDWLEKHGGHVKFINGIQVGDKVTLNEDGVLVNISQLNRVAKKDEKQGEQKSCMIQWKGDNLKEVIDFTGKDKNFEKWFKSFEEYEKYVHDHNDIFKLFNADGSHYEIPVGAWIVKTPDGYNVASKAKYKQKPTWSEEDENMLRTVIIACDITHKGETNRNFHDAQVTWLESIKNRVQPQPKQELKQENTDDLTNFESAMMHIGDSFFGQHAGLDPNDTNAIKEQANLLLELVPKQEWSEEDEKMYASIIDDTVQENQLDGKQINWLRNIKYRNFDQPQNTWKPSGRELGAMLIAICDERQKGSDVEKELRKIYQQLKKLKEE